MLDIQVDLNTAFKILFDTHTVTNKNKMQRSKQSNCSLLLKNACHHEQQESLMRSWQYIISKEKDRGLILLKLENLPQEHQEYCNTHDEHYQTIDDAYQE